ncbi:hypothetical protein CPC08DRAFT_755956 [Agrocybe pediades]|nr:hypothetical protein CPC08DRAFT_755956 [Agrocybe pediades]
MNYSKDILTHLRRELMHAVWELLLDDEFLHAYKYGIVIRCQSDGIERRIYPRIFTYSADYPEKVLLATMREGGLCPCPRCLMPKTKLDKMGSFLDTKFRRHASNIRKFLIDKVTEARRKIYNLAVGINGAAVQNLLKPSSSVPTMDFDVSRMLVVDFMHEFELGVWKNIFTHLIRILHAAKSGGRLVTELEERFRCIPLFGSEIRAFSNNVSDMKKLAARDYEDLLQLLYRTAEWHGFAKLRMHTETTLVHLDELTKEYGILVRKFRDLSCSQFDTYELPKEFEARKRQQERTSSTTSSAPSGAGRVVDEAAQPRNLHSQNPTGMQAAADTQNEGTEPDPQFHSMGDYVPTIRLFGCTDSYSTQISWRIGWVKRIYRLTNKRIRHATMQIGNRVRREEKARRAFEQEQRRKAIKGHADSDPSDRHHISHSRNERIDIYSFAQSNDQDPALKDFIPKLKDNILARLLERTFHGEEEFSDSDRNTVRIAGGRLYIARTCRINYTTYDIRRKGDIINPRTSSDIIVKSPETGEGAERFWYGRVIGIFHAIVSSSHTDASSSSSRSMDFLWVRWFGKEPGYRHGFKNGRLPKVGFQMHTDTDAFTFLDPSLVIRAAHLIPAFNEGRTQSLLHCANSVARVSIRNESNESDWVNYYVNIFVDRDMLTRHFSGGVGHSDNQVRLEATGALDTESESDEELDSDMDVEWDGTEGNPGNDIVTPDGEAGGEDEASDGDGLTEEEGEGAEDDVVDSDSDSASSVDSDCGL